MPMQQTPARYRSFESSFYMSYRRLSLWFRKRPRPHKARRIVWISRPVAISLACQGEKNGGNPHYFSPAASSASIFIASSGSFPSARGAMWIRRFMQLSRGPMKASRSSRNPRGAAGAVAATNAIARKRALRICFMVGIISKNKKLIAELQSRTTIGHCRCWRLCGCRAKAPPRSSSPSAR